ncbi:hypothetical protein M9458_007660, partial [Cirrhinus mrigala]
VTKFSSKQEYLEEYQLNGEVAVKMVFVKEESEEDMNEPEPWRIKQEEPETWRIKHEEQG